MSGSDLGGDACAALVALAPLRPAHAAALFPLLNDWAVVRMLAQVPWPLRLADVEAYALRQCAPGAEGVDFVILANGRPVGVCGVKEPGSGEPPRIMPRLGYWLGRAHWGRGYATQAIALLVEEAFRRFPDDAIGAGVFRDNPASRRVLEKLGFRAVGTSATHSRSRGRSVPTAEMQLRREAWRAARARP
jgi:RimJ/RimL family protein N-acetyltransferase